MNFLSFDAIAVQTVYLLFPIEVVKSLVHPSVFIILSFLNNLIILDAVCNWLRSLAAQAHHLYAFVLEVLAADYVFALKSVLTAQHLLVVFLQVLFFLLIFHAILLNDVVSLLSERLQR